MLPVLVFDIETIPDVDGIRLLREFDDSLSDIEVAEKAFSERFEKTGSEFLPLHLHRVVAISCVLRSGDGVRVWSLGECDASEKDIIQRFYDGIQKYSPQIISWNGGGFDLPVLHYRGLIHQVSAPRYWDQGEDDRDFKWNNYINRYHSRHLDLMDALAAFQPRANAPLDEIAQLLGFPGKVGMSGSKVWDTFCKGGIQDIRNYCETDVANTYLVYLRYQFMRGAINTEEYSLETNLLYEYLSTQESSHWKVFLNAWVR